MESNTAFFYSFAEMGEFVRTCKDEAVMKSTNSKIPKFNSPIYLQNKQQVGKVDEIFGPINEVVSTLDFTFSINENWSFQLIIIPYSKIASILL